MATISIVLYVVGPKFPLASLFPSFLEVNFSMLPIILTTLLIDYKYGMCALLLRFIIKLCFGTSTAGIGETADLIIGIICVLFIFLAKKIFKDKGNYIAVFISIILGFIVGGLISNVFALPMYINVMGFSKETFVGMLSKIHSGCTIDNFLFYYFICAILPFNALIGGMIAIISYLVYIPLEKANLKF